MISPVHPKLETLPSSSKRVMALHPNPKKRKTASFASVQPESGDEEQGCPRDVSRPSLTHSETNSLTEAGVTGGAFDHVVKMYENSGGRAEGFKDYVVQWSAAYYVAYGLLTKMRTNENSSTR